MDELNRFELAVLDNMTITCPSIKQHISYLRVISRENTGVGMYVKFAYLKADKFAHLNNGWLTNDYNITMEGIKNGMGFQIFIENGKINTLELFTYTDEWDGNIREFSFVQLPLNPK